MATARPVPKFATEANWPPAQGGAGYGLLPFDEAVRMVEQPFVSVAPPAPIATKDSERPVIVILVEMVTEAVA